MPRGVARIHVVIIIADLTFAIHNGARTIPFYDGASANAVGLMTFGIPAAISKLFHETRRRNCEAILRFAAECGRPLVLAAIGGADAYSGAFDAPLFDVPYGDAYAFRLSR